MIDLRSRELREMATQASPGARIYWKMRRLTGAPLLPWDALPATLQARYESVGTRNPALVPIVEELVSRELEMLQRKQVHGQ